MWQEMTHIDFVMVFCVTDNNAQSPGKTFGHKPSLSLRLKKVLGKCKMSRPVDFNRLFFAERYSCPTVKTGNLNSKQ